MNDPNESVELSETAWHFDVRSAQLVLLRFMVEHTGLSFTLEELTGMTNLPADLLEEALTGLLQGEVVSATPETPPEHHIPETQLPAARKHYAELTGQVPCRTCGCTQDWVCDDGCWWVEPDLCSTCGGDA